MSAFGREADLRAYYGGMSAIGQKLTLPTGAGVAVLPRLACETAFHSMTSRVGRLSKLQETTDI